MEVVNLSINIFLSEQDIKRIIDDSSVHTYFKGTIDWISYDCHDDVITFTVCGLCDGYVRWTPGDNNIWLFPKVDDKFIEKFNDFINERIVSREETIEQLNDIIAQHTNAIYNLLDFKKEVNESKPEFSIDDDKIYKLLELIRGEEDDC